jgi:hypothetical protein
MVERTELKLIPLRWSQEVEEAVKIGRQCICPVVEYLSATARVFDLPSGVRKSPRPKKIDYPY